MKKFKQAENDFDKLIQAHRLTPEQLPAIRELLDAIKPEAEKIRRRSEGSLTIGDVELSLRLFLEVEENDYLYPLMTFAIEYFESLKEYLEEIEQQQTASYETSLMAEPRR